jgi:flagellar biosynthetic protein FlhB
MALTTDTSGERTEAPTPLRFTEARRAGQVARSSDLVSVIVLLAGVTGLLVWGPGLLKAMRGMIVVILSRPGTASLVSPTEGVGCAISPVLRCAIPIVALPALSAIVANVLQFGIVVSGNPIKPNAGRILPSENLRRMFSLRSLVRGFLAVAKVAAVGVIFLAVVRVLSERILATASGDPQSLIRELGIMARGLGFRVLMGLGVLGIIDWGYQRWQYREDLKITRRELLDDLRRMERDPKIARRRARTGEQLTTQRLRLEIPKASLVLIDGGGLRKGLRVVARGAASLGTKIRALAEEYGIPVVTDKDLALQICRRYREGDKLPPGLSRRASELIPDSKQAPRTEHRKDRGGSS